MFFAKRFSVQILNVFSQEKPFFRPTGFLYGYFSNFKNFPKYEASTFRVVVLFFGQHFTRRSCSFRNRFFNIVEHWQLLLTISILSFLPNFSSVPFDKKCPTLAAASFFNRAFRQKCWTLTSIKLAFFHRDPPICTTFWYRS